MSVVSIKHTATRARSSGPSNEREKIAAFVEFVVKTYRMNWHQLSYQRQEEFLNWAMQNRSPTTDATRRQRRR